MNKRELASLVAKDTGKTMAEVMPIVYAAIDRMAERILANERICFSKLGTFYLKHRPQRMGYNPYRKIPIIIPSSMSLKFDASPSMRSLIKQKYSKDITHEKTAVPAEP